MRLLTITFILLSFVEVSAQEIPPDSCEQVFKEWYSAYEEKYNPESAISFYLDYSIENHYLDGRKVITPIKLYSNKKKHYLVMPLLEVYQDEKITVSIINDLSEILIATSSTEDFKAKSISIMAGTAKNALESLLIKGCRIKDVKDLELLEVVKETVSPDHKTLVTYRFRTDTKDLIEVETTHGINPFSLKKTITTVKDVSLNRSLKLLDMDPLELIYNSDGTVIRIYKDYKIINQLSSN